MGKMETSVLVQMGKRQRSELVSMEKWEKGVRVQMEKRQSEQTMLTPMLYFNVKDHKGMNT